METRSRIIIFFVFFAALLWAASALAGESGTVSCAHPGCGYQTNLSIGGGRKSPSVTGYCAQEKKFVRVKLQSWEDYRKPQTCPGGKEPLQPIYGGDQVAKIPCPKCGNLSLSYKRRLMFD